MKGFKCLKSLGFLENRKKKTSQMLEERGAFRRKKRGSSRGFGV